MGNFLLLASLFSILPPMPTATVPSLYTVSISSKKPVLGQMAAATTTIHEMRTVWVTAYSSTPEETDDTPFITASGTTVRNGIIATNLLPFGTKIQIPELFGERVFIVEDRMHRRKTNHVDIWMPTKSAAKIFGISRTAIVIVN